MGSTGNQGQAPLGTLCFGAGYWCLQEAGLWGELAWASACWCRKGAESGVDVRSCVMQKARVVPGNPRLLEHMPYSSEFWLSQVLTSPSADPTPEELLLLSCPQVPFGVTFLLPPAVLPCCRAAGL